MKRSVAARFGFSLLGAVGVLLVGLGVSGCCATAERATANPESLSPAASASGAASLPLPPYFRIQVVDSETKRGIPHVRLKTLASRVQHTDSAGVAAYYEPGWMDVDTWFEFESEGYLYPHTALGARGRTLAVRPGAGEIVEMERLNAAQRLYRVTGSGVYRDSVLLGDPVPLARPVNNANVVGQDSVQSCVYKGRVFWTWGDTSRASHPLGGNFQTTCAWSDLPGRGGLDPEVGVNLEYIVEDNNFPRKMLPVERPHLSWVSGLYVVRDEADEEVLYANYGEIKPPMTAHRRGLARFDEKKNRLETVLIYPEDSPITHTGYPARATVNGTEYFYVYSTVLYRVRATPEGLMDLDSHEAYTCLTDGARFDGAPEQLDRAPDGALRFSWKRDTSPIGQNEINQLVRDGHIRRDEAWLRLADVDTGKHVNLHNCSVSWNDYRRRWIMIVGESWGTSMLGEVWYAEAEAPEGPWYQAKKIVTHNNYSFYNPKQHSFFAKDGGRVVFFEGTYTAGFTGNENKTPDYEYNQVMYKLELDDPRLGLPFPDEIPEWKPEPPPTEE